MIDRRKGSIVILAASVVAQMVYADLTPVGGKEPGRQATVCNRGQCEPPETGLFCLFEGSFSAFDLELGPEETWPEPEVGAAEASDLEHYQGLTEGSTSFDLCLYALIGLGLCRSGQWVRRASLGFVPDWYHSGGPFLIGHSHALPPDSLCPIPDCCFVQPVHATDTPMSPHRLRAVVSLWRKSQFTPNVIASRASPLC